MLPFVVLVPVKPPVRGKSRLAGLPGDLRVALATAFARDTIAAAQAARAVTEVMVVTDDHAFAAAVRETGCSVLPDGVTGSLNDSLVQAAAEARRRWPDCGVAALCGDLPALVPGELSEALGSVGAGPVFVADHAGSGTTLYAVPPGLPFEPCFGPDSARAHHAAGATPVPGELASLRLDVDDAGDLGRAMLIGVGTHTSKVVGRTAGA
jgi:2-phospho-L-lactate/phosphoenolpyruvate guanylyltransferase